MDQCEHREEGVPPSKTTLCGEHESQTKAQRNQPGPPPSSVSVKSDQVKDVIKRFEDIIESSKKRNNQGLKLGPEPSVVSSKSILDNILIRSQQKYASYRKNKQRHNTGPVRRSMSLKTDGSKSDFINFKYQQVSAAERIHVKPAGPEPSFVSLESDWSAERPINFKVQPLSAAERVDQQSSEVTSGQSAQQHSTHLDSIFMTTTTFLDEEQLCRI